MIGEQIRNVRRSQNLTLEMVADTAGISAGYLSDIETGKKPGSVRALKAISAALQADLSHFFSTDDLAEEEMHLLLAFRELDYSDREAILRHASALARERRLKEILE